MEQNHGHIRNPLTVIGIFAGITEVFGTMILPNVDKSVQGDLLKFLTNFPFFLVTLFFLTLWFRRSVLYAPSDFRDDGSFLSLLQRDPKATPVNVDATNAAPAQASDESASATPASEPEAEPVEPASKHGGDTVDQPKPTAPVSMNNNRTKSFIRSGLHINAVAKKLKEKFSAPYSLSQSPKAMPGLHFDIVLTNSEWNYVGKVAVVTDSNWEEFLDEAQHWLNKVSAFRDALETRDALRLQGVFGLVYSPDSLTEDNLNNLLIHLRGIELQYPFGSYIEVYSLAELQA